MVEYQAAIKMTFQGSLKDLKKHLLYYPEWGKLKKKKTCPRPGTQHTCKKNFVALISIYKIASLYFKYIYTYINK